VSDLFLVYRSFTRRGPLIMGYVYNYCYSAFALYIERFAYYCIFFISRQIGPVIPTSAILKTGSSQQVTHLPLVLDLLLALAQTLTGTRNLHFTSHAKDEALNPSK
jgi:hypothetical protein